MDNGRVYELGDSVEQAVCKVIEKTAHRDIVAKIRMERLKALAEELGVKISILKKNKTMTTQQLEQIIKETPDQVTEVLSELSPHIREAAIVALASSQDNDKAKAAVSVGLTLSINPRNVSGFLEARRRCLRAAQGRRGRSGCRPYARACAWVWQGRKVKIKIEDRKGKNNHVLERPKAPRTGNCWNEMRLCAPQWRLRKEKPLTGNCSRRRCSSPLRLERWFLVEAPE